MNIKTLELKRQFILNKIVIGIDPAKRKHQVAILDENGIQQGKSFAFENSSEGYNNLWNKLTLRGIEVNEKNMVFAVETSCNLWQNITFYLFSKGFHVVLVSPLRTKYSRPVINNDFSRTDPKDAHIVACNAHNGHFDFYRDFSSEIKAMHHYSITYNKLKDNLVQNKTRIRALVERIFPEFINVLSLDTDTALYLLKSYFLPQDFLEIDTEEVSKEIMKISQKQHGKETLRKLKEAAGTSIGIKIKEEEILSYRISLDSWLILLEQIKNQMKIIMKELIRLVRQTPYFETLKSLKGISDKLAALFIAECRDLSLFRHYKKLEKYAGYNLRIANSGDFIGMRIISHIGNRRLSWIIYKMTEETVRYVPEVRMKFIRRQLRYKKYRKNIIASSSVLLRLIISLIKSGRVYEYREIDLEKMAYLEEKYKREKRVA